MPPSSVSVASATDNVPPHATIKGNRLHAAAPLQRRHQLVPNRCRPSGGTNLPFAAAAASVGISRLPATPARVLARGGCVAAAGPRRMNVCRGAKPGRARGGEDASLQLFVTMFQDEVKVFRDVSGRSMHRRGYRGVVHRAALNEAAAAGMLLMAGWPALAAQGATHRSPDTRIALVRGIPVCAVTCAPKWFMPHVKGSVQSSGECMKARATA